MKKLSLFLLIIALSISASAQTFELHTTNKKPTIIVPFLEETKITSFTFTDSNLQTRAMIYTTQDNYTYEFISTSQAGLPEGAYYLIITPEDTLGNPGEDVIINVYIDPVEIKLINPALEVSSTETFDIIIQTSAQAECRYSTVFSPEAYEDAPYQTTKAADNKHVIKEFTAPAYPSGKDLWVVCKDSFGYNTSVKHFFLSTDTTPPNIISAKAEPEIIIEYDAEGKKKTTLKTETDDPAICKYSTISQDYNSINKDNKDDLVDGYFAGNNETTKATYKKNNTKNLTDMANNEQYTYNIVCKNLAQLITQTPAKITFTVNLSAEFGITSTFPANNGFVGSKTFDMNLSTNKDAECYYGTAGVVDVQTSPKMTKLGKTGDYYWFKAKITETEEGQHKIAVYCKPQGAPEAREINYVIDTTPPKGIEIKTDNKTWIMDEIKAEFVFEDNESGIDYYTYSIKDNLQKVLVENKKTQDQKATVKEDKDGKKLNLTDGATYTWTVTATNKAGKTSTPITGKTEIDSTSKPKDIYLPTVIITTKITNRGTNITLACTDPGIVRTGCDANNSYYGTSDTETCSAAKTYNGTFTITKQQYICYAFQDKAQPPNTARNTIRVNVSEMLDADADGIRDQYDECLDTLPGKTVDEKGCSCEQLDDDKDQIDNCQDRCPNTPITETPSRDGCSETQRDSDYDGMLDIWEDNNGLDKYNPKDAKLDPDKDGLTNLKEFLYDTDPNNPDTDGDCFRDGGEVNSGTDPKDPTSKPEDRDGDCIDDSWERQNGLNPDDPSDAYQDPDNDGLNNFDEYNHGTNPQDPDTDKDGIWDGGEITSNTDPKDPTDKPPDADGDGMDDNWENRYDCTDPTKFDQEQDPDQDTLTNFKEYLWGTNPCKEDSDGDGMPDWWEIQYGLDPNRNDADEDKDKDKFTNYEEYRGKTNPRDSKDMPLGLDSDGDGIPDWWEKEKGLNAYDPTDAEEDQDDDNLLSIEEYTFYECLEPLEYDTDGDGHSDGKEVNAGTDPCDPASKPANYWWLIITLIILAILGAAGYLGYRYYPQIKEKLEKRYGKPTLKKWPPFEKIVGRPEPKKTETKKEEKPKTTEEKLKELSGASFDKLEKLSAEEKETQEKKTNITEKLENIGKAGFDRLADITKTKKKLRFKKTKEDQRIKELKEKTPFAMLERVGEAVTKKEVFKALPGKKADVFTELKKTVSVPKETLNKITEQTEEKNVEDLVKTFEQLKAEQGTKTSLNIFKTLLGHLMKSKKITIKDVEEVLLKLKDEKIFTEKQVSDVLFALKE